MRSSQGVRVALLRLPGADNAVLPMHKTFGFQHLHISPIIGIVDYVRSHSTVTPSAKAEEKLFFLHGTVPNLGVHRTCIPRKVNTALSSTKLDPPLDRGAPVD